MSARLRYFDFREEAICLECFKSNASSAFGAHPRAQTSALLANSELSRSMFWVIMCLLGTRGEPSSLGQHSYSQ